MTDNVFTSNDTSVFIQKFLGDEYHYLGQCLGVDDIPNELPGRDPIICTKDGNLTIIGKKQTAPSLIEFTVENLLQNSANWLDLLAERGCRFILHALVGCNQIGIFDNNADNGYSVMGVDIINEGVSDIAQRDADDEIVENRTMNAIPPRIKTWDIFSGQKTTAETTDINSITATPGTCPGSCGDQKETCEELWAAADAVASATANLLRSQDGGATWAATAADPFAVDEDIFSVRAIRINNTTTRIIVAREADAANPLEVGYSDDYGATWTMVTVGATNNEAVTEDAQIFVYDNLNIWLGTSLGRIFKSSDMGVTWTEQTSALAAGGANSIDAIYFITDKIGFAVGGTDTVIVTTDGGVNWSAGTATGGGNNLLGVVAWSQYHLLVADDGGELYVSYDGAVTWTQRTEWTGTGTGSIQNLKKLNDLVLYMVHVDGSGNGHLLKSINSGYSFDRIGGYTASAGYNAVHICSNNHAFVVGEDDGVTGIIVEAGSSEPQ